MKFEHKSGTYIVPLLLLLLPRVSADCNGLSEEASALQFQNVDEGSGSLNKVFFNTSQPSTVSLSLDVSPAHYVILQETSEGSNNRWIIRANGTLDYEQVQSVRGSLFCSQQGHGQITHAINILISDVNEFAPNFSHPIYVVSVNELSTPGTVIFNIKGIASDRDGTNAAIFYTLSSTQSLFGLNRYGTSVVTMERLDYDFSDRQYNITITARELIPKGKTATALLTINIQDGDDLNPVFDQPFYNTTVNEGLYTNQVLYTNPPIHAADRDTGVSATLEYEIKSVVPDSNFFTILSNGSILVNGDLQPETAFSINIRVSQVNRSEERYDDAVVLVVVADVNDHPPRMSAMTYDVDVTENSPPGTVITTLNATDADNGLNAVFFFYFSTPTDVFEIDTEGDYGFVRVREGATLDREKKASYDLQVYAGEILTAERYNSSVSSLVITVLDVNDNSPVFNSSTYTYDIYKNDTVGTVLGKVTATDIDEGVNGEVVYSLQHTTSSLFGLDHTTGEITVNGTLGDDNVGQVYMVIGAEDQATNVINRRTSVATVIITIQDIDLYPPTFNQTQYHVAVLESLPVQSLLLQLHATDLDDDDILSFSIVSGNDNNTFQIDATSGVMTLSRPLDRETRDHFALTAQVSDGQKTGSAPINVTVLDVNDNNPVFSNLTYVFSMDENTGSSASVGLVQATDADEGPNREITYSIISESSQNASFEINGSSGEITTISNLDYEIATTHVLLVSATDHGHPARTGTTSVTVNVKDLNDNSPTFVSRLDSLTVQERTTGIIYTAVAQDLDSGANGITEYYKSSGPTDFTVFRNGSVLATTELSVGNYNITVTASNTVTYDSSCTPCGNNSLTIMVHVSDVNDNPPRFNQSLYTTTIDEGRVNNPVIRVFASDEDVDTAFNSITYSISGSAYSDRVFISSTTGSIYIFGDVDYDPPSSDKVFNFTVEGVNPADQTSRDSTVVTINIRDINDNTPTFDRATYQCRVTENTTSGSEFGCQVNASDIDSSGNGEVVYSIIPSNFGIFDINPNNGLITLAKEVDYENKTRYTLRIKATDRGSPSKEGFCDVVIDVIDINDTPPTFTGIPYEFSILETSAITTTVGVLSANDPDTNTHLAYTLVGHSEKLFSLNLHDAVLQTLSPFNCSDVYRLNVSVSDGVHTVFHDVTVNVMAVNSYTPQYVGETNFSVMENITAGNKVGKVEAIDADCKVNGHVTYGLVGGDSSDVFEISSQSGEITLKKCCLNYESTTEYRLLVKAEDGGSPPRINFTSVTVNVIDVDDVKPEFDKIEFTAIIAESAADGSFILKLTATDQDTASDKLRYSAITASPNITVNSSGVVTVHGGLDADGFSNVIKVNVSVTDGTRSNMAMMRITVEDVNDNYPLLNIGESNIQVPENADVGQVIVNVNATDADRGNNGFTFWLTRTDGKFSINASSGVISVENEFDRRFQDLFHVGIHVSDHGIPPKYSEDTLTVEIIDSNHAPVFNESVFTFNVMENASIDAMVGQIAAYDVDRGTSGTLRYTFISGNNDRTFSLDSSTGNITLNKEVDYEYLSQYTLLVKAKDESYSPKTATGTVIINIQDIPEAPQWPLPLPVVYMMRSRSCDKSRVTAFSRDITSITNSPSPVIYSLFNQTDKFSLNNETGSLTAVSPSTLDIGEYVLVLEACNKDHPDLCTSALLTIRVTSDTTVSFCPAFMVLSIPENAEIGYTLVDLNTTVDDGQLHYAIIDGDSDGTFSIDGNTGVVTLFKSLDREATARYALLIEAGNGTQNAQTQVVVQIVDVKDTPPVFPLTEYDGQVSEGSVVGDSVLMTGGRGPLVVTAQDRDQNTQLTYSIDPREDNSNGSFTINNITGVISLSETVDRETMPPSLDGKYTFKVLASDENNTASTIVVVVVLDVNDNNPIFVTHILNVTIPENSAPGVPVITVNATDADTVDDGQLKFYIRSPTNAPFSISEYTGIVSVNAPLDRETIPDYTLEIEVQDSGNRTDTMLLHVFLSDVNDKKPMFENSTYVFKVQEGPDGVNASLTLSANDLDVNNLLTFSIINGNADGYFKIKSTGNEALLEVEQALDRERTGLTIKEGMATVNLTLQVEDDGTNAQLSSTCIVQVFITDINDNSPEFNNINYIGIVRENSPNMTVVQVRPPVSAADPDNGINGTQGIRYRFVGDRGPFMLDPLNGTVYVFYSSDGEILDRENTTTYDLKISAQDADGTGKTTVTNLTIIVEDVNDVIPTFNSDVYTFNVSESAQSQKVVGVVSASDNDHNGQESLRYDIVSGDNFRFYMRTLTGELRVAGGLDRERQSTYSLNISAFDGLNSGFTTVNISIIDANDNCPIFNSSDLTFSVHENSGNVTIGHLAATDADAGINAELSFYANDTTIQGLLTLLSNGSLVTMAPLDREKRSSYSFLAYVSDHGNPPCVTSSTVTVEVMDENDITPAFCHEGSCDNSDITASILEKSPIDSVVALPVAVDNDAGENARISFSLVGNGSDLFTIDANSGLVKVAKSIDINKLYEKGIISGNFSNNATFDLYIIAMDHGSPSLQSNITLHLYVQELNDGAPEFKKNVYNFTIPEEEIDYTVGKVEAFARNETGVTLVYSIIESSHNDNDFIINSFNGTIRTRVKLDRESRDQYSFAVQVRDGRVPERTAYSVVFVTLSDINDNTPTFPLSTLRLEVLENSPPSQLSIIRATDTDLGTNADITYTISYTNAENGVFLLNDTTGQLLVNQSLDRELQSSYTLNITATDGGVPPRSSTLDVNVTVLDVNDNVPRFMNTPYIVTVTENSPQGHPLLDIKATDDDDGLNGQVVYRLISSHDSEVFQIGALDGKLSVFNNLDFEKVPQYRLTVMANDLGTPPLNSTATIVINVNDTYDTRPKFTSQLYEVTVPIATPVGTQLGVNIDAGNGNFYYNITAGNSDILFTINQDTGSLSTSGEITTQGEKMLTIMASDKMPNQSFDTTKVHVTITKPEVTFPESEYDVKIPEDAKTPIELIDLNSSAEDQNLPVIYTFTDQTDNTDGTFALNSSTGVLTCLKPLDRETKKEYRLFIQVTLATGRSKRAVSNIAEVRIVVEDVNDNAPVIQTPRGGGVVAIPDTAPPNYLLVHLKGSDKDTGINSVLRFSAASGNTEVFGVNPTSGEVRSLVAMSTVTQKSFSLTVNVTDNNGAGLSSTLALTIVVITDEKRFGLVAHMQPAEFNRQKENIIGNLSNILGLEVQLENVQPHTDGDKLDLTKSDIYFHAIDPKTSTAASYKDIQKLVTANQAAIDLLLRGSSALIPVTPAPTTTPTVVKAVPDYGISEAEIAVLVIAGIMFIGSVAAVVAIIRIFKRYEEWNEKQEKARMVRDRQRKITEERTVDEGFNETNLDSDTAEPLDLDASEESGSREFNPGLMLRQTRMAEAQGSLHIRRPSVSSKVSYEEKEQVINMESETKDYDTITLKTILASRELDNVLQLYDMEDSTSDSGTGLDDLSEELRSTNEITPKRTSGPSKSELFPLVKTNGAIDHSSQNANKTRNRPDQATKPASNKGSIKSNKTVTFTNVVTIDAPDSGNSSDSGDSPTAPLTRRGLGVVNRAYEPTLVTNTGELVTWF